MTARTDLGGVPYYHAKDCPLISDVPGALGMLLRDGGHRARVVEREDGAAVTDDDRGAINDAVDAAEEQRSKVEGEHPLRELVFVRGMRRGDAYDQEHVTDEGLPRVAVGGA